MIEELYGEIPVLVNPDWIFVHVKSSCQACQNILLNLPLTQKLAKLSVKRWLSSLVLYLARDANNDTSRGWSRWVECGASIISRIRNRSHCSINWRLIWLEWSSRIKRRRDLQLFD